MKLRPRTVLIVAATTTAFMLALTLALPRILLRSYEDLERRDARVDANRVARALDESVNEMSLKVADWGSWDDTYNFISDHNPAFPRSNLTPATYDLLRIDLIVLLDASGQIVYARQRDPMTKALTSLSPELLVRLAPNGSVLRGSLVDPRAGIVMLREGPMLVATRPILTSEDKGPPRGTVLFGRRLDATETQRLAQRTLLDVRLLAWRDPAIRAETALAREAMMGGDSVAVRPQDARTVTTVRALRDIAGRPAMLAVIQSPRDIVDQGRRSVGAVLLWVLVAMLLMGALTVLLVERAVLRRLMRLGEDVSRVRQSGDPGQRVFEAGADELSDLARGVNAMLAAIDAQQHDLLETRDAAQAANRAKTQFLATMSHEIRTPMNGVLGMMTMLLQTPLSHEQRDYTLLATSSAESLLDLLNDILDLSKIEADRMTLESVPFDLVELLEDLAELMSVRAHERGLELVVHVTPGAPRAITGDPVRLRQVVLNLVGNAIKFTRRGAVTIELRREDRVTGAFVRLNVIDTGPGIAPDVQSRLFSAFTQADASTARQFGGTGLGLTISKRLVELMGGSIELKSQPGQGSTFGVRVPLQAATLDDTGVAWPVPPPGRCVLVVDDLEPSRVALADALRSGGVDVVTVNRGAKAFELLRASASRFDAIVADAPLADVDPAAFARRLQKRWASIPRIMLDARPRPGAMAVAETEGWAAYLPKPVRAAVLLAVVEATTRDPARRPKGIVTRHSIAEALEMAAAAEPRHPSFLGLQVLVADDVRLNQMVAKVMLESLGCSVEVVRDGRRAIERVQGGDIDVVFMDMHMPEMNGLQATHAIRSLPSPLANTPIIALSAGAMTDERAACLDAGMNDFVAKPVRPEELARALQGVMGNRRAAA